MQLVMGPQLAELDKGKIDQETFDGVRARRAEQIEQTVIELMRGPEAAAPCDCGKPATTTIAGKGYCTRHAADAPRVALPEKLRA